MKKLIAATTALTLLTSSVGLADEAPQANMPIEIVTQDTVDNALSGDVLVPILTLIFLLMIVGGGHSYYPT